MSCPCADPLAAAKHCCWLPLLCQPSSTSTNSNRAPPAGPASGRPAPGRPPWQGSRLPAPRCTRGAGARCRCPAAGGIAGRTAVVRALLCRLAVQAGCAGWRAEPCRQAAGQSVPSLLGCSPAPLPHQPGCGIWPRVHNLLHHLPNGVQVPAAGSREEGQCTGHV